MWCLNILKYLGSKLINLIDNEQFWKYIKLIPLINTIFGLVRVIRNRISGNCEEAIKSGLNAVAGIAAVLIPIYLGVGCLWAFLLCSAINNVIGGFGSFIVDLINKEKHRNANWSDFEKVIYERVIKVSPLFAGWYCSLRALVFLIYEDKRHAKASAKDLFINIISIAVAYIVFLYIDSSKLVALIKECLGTKQNGFTHDVLTCILKLLTSQIFILSAPQCINVFAQLLRNSSLLMEAQFPYNEPNKEKFIQCLQRPHHLIQENSDKSYMELHLIKFMVKCFVREPDDSLLYKELTHPNKDGIEESVLELAFQGRNPGVLQTVIAFVPSLIEKQSTTIDNDRILNDSNGCINHILDSCLKPMSDPVCHDTHDQYRVILEKPTVYRPHGPPSSGGKRVLTIDGGGTRGVVSLEILRQLEKRLGNISTYFDLIVGTSTGGLIALLLADGERCIDEIQKLYFKLKDEVFCGRKGNEYKYQCLLKEIFKDREMGSIPKSTRVVITASFEQKGYEHGYGRMDFTNFDETSIVPIWKVARCTSAAPGYFPPFKVNELGDEYFLDGGMGWNNPVLVAFYYLNLSEEFNSTIVSIGTGLYNDKKQSKPSKPSSPSRSLLGILKTIIDGALERFVKRVVNHITRTEGDIMETAKIMCRSGNAYFYRLNPILSEKLELDETDDEKLVNAIWHTKVFARNHESIIEEIANRLKVEIKDQIISVTKYEDKFESEIIRIGGFGGVYKVKEKSTNLYSAVKIIEIRDDIEFEREIEMISKLKSPFVVQYMDSWIEERLSLPRKKKYLFIQMEWCPYNLRTFLDEIYNEKSEIANYFISCELLIELIEGVNYLQSFNPPIMHRDLKPDNILISYGINGRFLKLCDFGLAVAVQERSEHTRGVGTMSYMAPEVINSTRYNTKADIYSLALIATEIYRFKKNVRQIRNDINLSKYSKRYSSPNLNQKFNLLLKTLSKCLSKDSNLRPDCRQLLSAANEWTVDINTVLNDEKILDFRTFLTLDRNTILKKFFETKLNEKLHLVEFILGNGFTGSLKRKI